MKSSDVRKKYIEFFKKHGHMEIPSARLIPENDPTTLFTSSGMQPLIPYLLGESHPFGKRLVNSQKSFRAQDIQEVGDNRHTTFFEMLGNWSLGDYFKKEQLTWIFEYLTREVGLEANRLFVTVFEGNSSVPRDDESISIWQDIFSRVKVDAKVAGPKDNISKKGIRIFAYPAKKNWWSRSGEPEFMPPGEPGGPDSEVFYDFGAERKLHEHSTWKNELCHPNCDCGRFVEVANSVFMQYQKQADGSLRELVQKNVDFGGGFERIVAASEDTPDVFLTDLFVPLTRILETLSKNIYGDNDKDTRAMRIISDHIRGAVMMISDGVQPSNKTQGYILRRLIRRSLLYGRSIGLQGNWDYVATLVEPVATIYESQYPDVSKNIETIKSILIEEAMRFGKTLEKGLREIEKLETLDGKKAFVLYETYGFPWEMTEEIASQRGQNIERLHFEEEFKKHQELSRTAAKGMFKGGLADHSEMTTKLHTATHLLHQSLRSVLGTHVTQKGSNITAERLRFDYSQPVKLTPEQIMDIEKLVNKQILNDLHVSFKTMTYKEALEVGALAFFGERYPQEVKVYSMGNFSKEICGGPHVEHTGVLGTFKITRDEALGSGVRRIYATLE